jgi:hypothetical protein
MEPDRFGQNPLDLDREILDIAGPIRFIWGSRDE